VNKVDPRDDTAAGRFNLDIDFTAQSYGQVMQERLLIFSPRSSRAANHCH